MPEALHRCVQHVMDQGHPEQSAWAICRSSMGLKTDGSEDGNKVEMTDEQIQSRVAMALQFQNGPALIKDMVVAHKLGKFVNGDQRGTMTDQRLKDLADRYKKYPRQVPIFLASDHPETNDQIPPVGWAEGVRFDPEAGLVVRAKLFGEGATAVGGDLIRLASIFTVQGKNYDGSPQGEVLKHVLLNNESYIKDLNVAATQERGEQVVACFVSALSKEAIMAEKKKAKVEDGTDAAEAGHADQLPEEATIASLKDEKTALECLIQEKDGQIEELTASNANLLEEVKMLRSDTGLVDEVKKLKRHNQAERIRRLVGKGVAAGQFKKDKVNGYDHDSDEVVLAWFKNSMFKGNEDTLTFALATFEKKVIGRTFNTGDPGEIAEVQMSDEDRKHLIALGHKPEDIQAALKSRGTAEYNALTGKEA